MVSQILVIVFNVIVNIGCFQYFEVEICVLFELLCFEQFIFFFQLFQVFEQFFFDVFDGLIYGWVWCYIVVIGVDMDFFKCICMFISQGIKFVDVF